MRGCPAKLLSLLALIALIAAGAGACGHAAKLPARHPTGARAQNPGTVAAGVVRIESPELHATHEQMVFVNVDAIEDRSKRIPISVTRRLTDVVRTSIQLNGYATASTGALPTSFELSARGYRGFIVAATVQRVTIAHTGARAEIACTVAVRIARWSGTDGGEQWEPDTAANATGAGHATTAWREDRVEQGVSECIETVVYEVTSRQVVPFLRRVAALD
ncbi:MAG: hypothetical protein AB7P03_24405 [Kofleriaceae bacterium]